MNVLVLVVTVVGVGYLAWRGLIVILESKRWPEPNVKPFWCTACQHGFRTGTLYSAHLNSQHQERFGPLKAHLDSVDAAREQPCPKCDMHHATRHDQLLCPGPQQLQRVSLKLVR